MIQVAWQELLCIYAYTMYIIHICTYIWMYKAIPNCSIRNRRDTANWLLIWSELDCNSIVLPAESILRGLFFTCYFWKHTDFAILTFYERSEVRCSKVARVFLSGYFELVELLLHFQFFMILVFHVWLVCFNLV